MVYAVIISRLQLVADRLDSYEFRRSGVRSFFLMPWQPFLSLNSSKLLCFMIHALAAWQQGYCYYALSSRRRCMFFL